MKRILTLALVFGLALSLSTCYGIPVSCGGTVLVVSDSKAPGDTSGTDHRDDALVAVLQGLGYTVDTSGMGGAMKEGGNSPWATGNESKLAALQAADLVLVSRRTGSGSYDNDRKGWNELGTPLLLMSGYLTRGESSSKKWGWTTGGSGNAAGATTDIDVVATGHEFLAGLSDPITAFDWAPLTGAPKGVFLPNKTGSDPVTGVVVVGKFDGRDMIYDIPAGTDFDADNGTTGKYGVAGARRAFIGHWGYDGTLPVPLSGDSSFDDFITADYITLMDNAICVLIPEPATIALLGLGGLALLRRRR